MCVMVACACVWVLGRVVCEGVCCVCECGLTVDDVGWCGDEGEGGSVGWVSWVVRVGGGEWSVCCL